MSSNTNKFCYLVLIISVFLFGIYVGYLTLVPTINIDEIRKFTIEQNSIFQEYVFSEQHPPRPVNNGRAVLITISCDADPKAILSLTDSFHDIHFIFDTPAFHTRNIDIENSWDIAPCFPERERFEAWHTKNDHP